VEIFGIERFGKIGRTDDVAEKNREMPALARGQDRSGGVVGRLARRRSAVRQARTAAAAKPAERRAYDAADAALDRQCCTTFRAEPSGIRILRFTAGTFHETPDAAVREAPEHFVARRNYSSF